MGSNALECLSWNKVMNYAIKIVRAENFILSEDEFGIDGYWQINGAVRKFE